MPRAMLESSRRGNATSGQSLVGMDSVTVTRSGIRPAAEKATWGRREASAKTVTQRYIEGAVRNNVDFAGGDENCLVALFLAGFARQSKPKTKMFLVSDDEL